MSNAKTKHERFDAAMKQAAQEEIKRGERIKNVYIVGDEVYFDELKVENLDVEYTLVRGDMDTNFPTDITTSHGPERGGF